MNLFYGIKGDQSQGYDAKGNRVPLTWVKVEPMTVIGTKTQENDDYSALKVTFGSKKNLKKPLQGLLKNLTEKISPRFFKEVKITSEETKNPGDKISISDVFAEGDTIKVSGISKGKGFAGVVKRHGFKGGPMTHGTSTKQRHPGSIGQTTTPGRVYKGKRMGGHMGNEKVTVKNLKVFSIKPEENLVAIVGLIPGSVGSLVTITKD